jgi:hypothetical protein
VLQVFAAPRKLKLHGPHLAERLARYSATRADFEAFDPRTWEIVMVEVRCDTGKFVSTTLRRRLNGQDWWIVIGFGDTIRTLYPAKRGKRGKGAEIVRAGPLWKHVATVNAELVAAHARAVSDF